MWRSLLLFLLLVVLVPQGFVSAGNLTDTADINVTATGYTSTAPYGLTLTYVSDYEIEAEWSPGYNVTATMIRVAYGRPVEDIDDGYEVYSGNATNTTIWLPNVGLVGPIYVRAFGQDGSGSWETTGDTAEGDFMSISFLFAILVILGLALFIAAFRWKDMLLSYAAALTWMAMGFWWILGDLTNFGLSEPWSQILVFVPFVLSFSVLLRLMNTEIVSESKGRKWTEWGPAPREEKIDRRVEYRNTLRKRIGGR